MATQAERRAATSARIVAAGHSLFVKWGFDHTTTDMILDQAKVSRGAMYHHFASKDAVFAAVFEEVTMKSVNESRGSVSEDSSPLDALLACCLAWLENVSQPEVATILLEQGPAVLGWKRCREIDESHSLKRMAAAIRAAQESGEIEVVSAELTAKVLNAALSEMALALVHQPGDSIDTREAQKLVVSLLRGFKSDWPQGQIGGDRGEYVRDQRSRFASSAARSGD